MTLSLNNTARVDTNRVYVAQQVIDCSEISVPSDGQVDVMDIPAGFDAQLVRTEVLTAEGSTLKVDVGDTGTIDTFGSDLDANSTSTDNVDTSGGSSSPYTSDDNLRIKFLGSTDGSATQPSTAKLRITAVFFDIGPQ